MARPSKGDRVAFTVRLPVELASRIKAEVPGDRHSFIVAAVEAKLEREQCPK